MAVKGGDVIHVGNNTVLLDRLQTAGPGQLNIRKEKVYELGNYLSVGQIADIPDLSFSMESFDVSCEMEAFLTRQPVASTHTYDLATARVVNVKSAFKPGKAATALYDTVASAAVPCLRLEQMQWRFGVGNNNARQTATLRGDSLYYNAGSTYIQSVAGSGSAGQTIVLTNPSYAVTEGGVTRWTIAVTAGDRRLNFGSDYTESGTITGDTRVTTVTITSAVPATDTIDVVYASPTVESFPQSAHALVEGLSTTTSASAASGATSVALTSGAFAAGDTIIIGTGGSAEIAVISAFSAPNATLSAPLASAHASGSYVAHYSPTVKPAAIRGRDIDIYIGPASPPGTAMSAAIGTKRGGVQSADVDWRVQLTNDEEMGNYHYVSTDFDVPEVSGNLTFRPATPQVMLDLMQDLSGESNPLRSAQSQDSPLLDVQIVLKNPKDGRVLKRLWIPDARFTLPGYSARVQQRLDVQSAFTSDQGVLVVADH